MSAHVSEQPPTIQARTLHLLLLTTLGTISGLAWILGGAGPIGPLLSILLVAAVAAGRNPVERLVAALTYYAIGCGPIVGAVAGYWGTGHAAVGLLAWAACSVALAMPWALATHWRGLLFALAVTAVPPLGVIGWLSPMNAAGVLFPGGGWVGVIGLLLLVALWPAAVNGHAGARIAIVGVLAGSVLMNLLAVVSPPALMPQDWVGVQTHLRPGDGNILASIQNNRKRPANPS